MGTVMEETMTRAVWAVFHNRHRRRQKLLPTDEGEVLNIRADLAAALPILTEDGSASWECLDMVRERLASFGIDMDATPPMFYDNAIESLVARLGKRAGITRRDEIVAIMREKPANVG